MPSIQWDDEVTSEAQTPEIVWGTALDAPRGRSALPPAQEETLVDRGALVLDKVLRSIEDAVPSYLPSRQDILDIAGGMAGMGGLLEDAPRIRGTTTDSGWKTLGKVLDPAMMAVGGKAFQAAREAPAVARMGSELAKNVIGGAAAGGAVGSFSGEPVEGALLGAAAPGVIQGGGRLLAPAGRRIGEVFDAALGSGGATRAAGRVATDVAKEDAAAIAQALRAGVSTETAAQAAAPVGRAEFSGLERIIGARDPSTFGPMGKISQSRVATEKQAWNDLKTLTDPEREAVLMAANAGQSGVPLTATSVLESIQTVAQAPGYRANPTVQGVLAAYKKRLSAVTDPETGAVNAHDLYSLRKDMGAYIEGLADTAKWDKKLARGLVRGLQKEMDFAIERSSGMIGPSGGSRWEDYLNAFRGGAQKIEAFAERAQRAKLQGAAGLPEAKRISKLDETMKPIVNPLDRAVMLLNAGLRRLSGYGGEKTTNELVRLMKPESKNELAQLIEQELARRGQRLSPSQTNAMVEAVLAGRAAGEQ